MQLRLFFFWELFLYFFRILSKKNKTKRKERRMEIKGIRELFLPKRKNNFEKEKIAEMLKISPEYLEQFENEYRAVMEGEIPEQYFDYNAKQAAELHSGIPEQIEGMDEIINRIVEELIDQTPIWKYDGVTITATEAPYQIKQGFVTNNDLERFPKQERPMLSGKLIKKDINGEAYPLILKIYHDYKKEKNPGKKMSLYGMFRQGVDIQDLDPVIYEILGMNKNSMGYWLPRIIEPILSQNFFKVPKTTIIKVPLPVLQLTRLSYETLNRTTLDIVDQFCKKVFALEEDKEYFIKTGTYSSKFDFRNAVVRGAKEVRELGEYLIFIQNYACMMAAPTVVPCTYGVSTTNEWVVREYIQDEDIPQNPCIYKGLPLHTEYRIFVDFDTKEVLGINPYWDPKVMKQRFGHEEDADNPHQKHDYIIYLAHEECLMKRYNENKDLIKEMIKNLIMDIRDMHGQWSIDVMQNGKHFYIIDMAFASLSALKECIPPGKLKQAEEEWLPDFSNLQQ